MSKKLSFKGQIPVGEQQKIKLATKEGKRGYKITQLKMINKSPGTSANPGLLCKVYIKDQSGSLTDTVDFTEGDLIAVAFFTQSTSSNTLQAETIIFDNTVFNQDIFVYIVDPSGATDPGNYYMELETVSLSDVESTQLTLSNLRTIASR